MGGIAISTRVGGPGNCDVNCNVDSQYYGSQNIFAFLGYFCPGGGGAGWLTCLHDIPNSEGVFMSLKNANLSGSGFILWKFQYFRISIFVKSVPLGA